MAATILDSIAALRVVYLLITPIQNTSAFMLGLIDADGKTIRKATTPEEKNSTSMLHRLVWSLKRMIGLIPGGSTRIGSAVAAYLLMKEAVENKWTEQELNEQCISRFNSLCEQECNELNALFEELYVLDEDAPTNSSGAVVSTDIPLKKLGALVYRKKFKTIYLPT